MAGPAQPLSGELSCSTARLCPRPAVPGDAEALAQLDLLVNPSPWSSGQFISACRESSRERALLLEDGGNLVGFVVYSLVLDEACIHNIAVHPDRRRQGLGAALLGCALSAAQSAGASRCYLELRASNRPAHELYTRLGFQLDGRRRDYYPLDQGREDALLMSRQL